MRTRRLVLAKETLAELANEDLLDVVGAAAQAITPVAYCVENVASKVANICRSTFDPCPTI